MRPFFLAFCLATPTATPAAAQTPPELTTPAPLADNVAATPKLRLTTPQAVAINAALASFDTAGLQELLACDSPARELRVMLRSAEFYSYYVNESAVCEGAAHPYFNESFVTFDLTTGAPVVWPSLLPESLLQTKSADYDEAYPIRSAALNALYLAHKDQDPECDETFAYPVDFSFALDAATQSLAMAPVGLPYAALACADAALIPLTEAKTLGLGPRLITALETGAP